MSIDERVAKLEAVAQQAASTATNEQNQWAAAQASTSVCGTLTQEPTFNPLVDTLLVAKPQKFSG